MKKDLNRQQLKNKPKKRRLIIDWRIIMIAFIFIVYMGAQVLATLKDVKPTEGELKYYELKDLIEAGEVEKINVIKTDRSATVVMKDGTVYDIVNPQSDTFIEDLMKWGADISFSKQKMSDAVLGILLVIPMASIMAIFAAYLCRTVLGASTKMFTLLKVKDNDTYFDDIRGISETKKEVQFIIRGLKEWKKLGEVGARPIKGVLFYGPPGTGKTLLAKAIANEAGVPFISASGSDFNEVFVGTGARRIRDLWDLATSNAPCIIFIDEIDCIGKRRRGSGAEMENNQTINALLQKMDGLNSTPGVIVIGATNDKDALDEALLRSGRFDRELFVGPPANKKDRDSVVELYLDNKKLADEVTVEKASKLLVGLTAADIDEALSEAVYISLMDNRDGIIKLSDIDEAAMKIHLSGVKKDHSSQRDKEVTAIHEAGHALTSLLLGVPVLKVSIQAYSSGVGGITIRDTDETGDIKLKLKSEQESDIKILLGGKCAEDIKYGEHTQGCSNDIDVASKKVYDLITSMGHTSDKMLNQTVLLESGVIKGVSQDIITQCNDTLYNLDSAVRKMLKDNEDKLYKLADMLLEQETIVSPTLDSLT